MTSPGDGVGHILTLAPHLAAAQRPLCLRRFSVVWDDAFGMTHRRETVWGAGG